MRHGTKASRAGMAVMRLKEHFDAVSRGDPEALELQRQVNEALRAKEARRVRVEKVAAALAGLTDEGLDKVESIVREHEATRSEGR